jgi:hypothetical protein
MVRHMGGLCQWGWMGQAVVVEDEVGGGGSR